MTAHRHREPPILPEAGAAPRGTILAVRPDAAQSRSASFSRVQNRMGDPMRKHQKQNDDRIHYLEAKLILKPDRFTSVDSFRYFAKQMHRTAKALDIGYVPDPDVD